MAQTFINQNACEPAVTPRCGSPNYPLFEPGISTRLIPVCSQPSCECDVTGIGRYRVTPQGTLDRSHWIEGWIINQLSTRGEVTCEEHTLSVRAGGWWADAFRSPVGFKSGSKLWSLQWAHVTNDALLLAKQFATEALQYLLAWGIASKIKIDASYISQKVMRLQITVTGPGISGANAMVQGQAMPNSGWLWNEYKPGA